MDRIPESIESFERDSFHDEVAALFDLSSVDGKEHYVETSQNEQELVETSRIKLDEYGRLTTESYSLKLNKSPERRKDLVPDDMKLFDRHILRSASETVLHKEKLRLEYMDTSINTKGVTYTHMPVHRYDVEERGILYDEPQRDRDKNYRAEQHNIISNFERCEVPTATPKHYLKMGKYNRNQEVPENFWAPQFQTFMRRQKILRCMRYISETYCVIDVYSLGHQWSSL